MFAAAWKDELPESHRIALDVAYSDFLDAHLHISPVASGKIVQVSDWLPKKFTGRYTPTFCHKFIIGMSSVAERLAQPNKITPVPRCTAEAFALHILIQHASNLLKEIQRIESDYALFKSLAYRDNEFLELYDAVKDDPGVDLNSRIPLPNNLEFNDWFIPFNRNEPVNPFLHEDWETQQAGINFFR